MPPKYTAGSGAGGIQHKLPPRPSTTGRGSSSNIIEGGKDMTSKEEIEVENFGPPKWRTVLNKRADLGYPDFYPSRPGFQQPEDILTEKNVQEGFSAKQYVNPGAESFSMHGHIHSHLINGMLENLNKLGEEILQKRDEGMPQFGDRTFRIPVRVTYNDVKRSQFLADLGNSTVPLHRLMRNPIPHGFKGLELLDAMFLPQVGSGSSNTVATHNRTGSNTSVTPTSKPVPDSIPIKRASWFIRVLGANEVSAHRGRSQPTITASSNTPTVAAPSPAAVATPSSNISNPNPTSAPLSSNTWYTQEFTNTFVSWLRMQLAQLALPASKTTPKNSQAAPLAKATTSILADENARQRWLKKWSYSCALLRDLHSQNLISSSVFCHWLSDTLSTCNLAQLGFAAQLSSEYLPDIAGNIYFARPCIRAICQQITDIRASKRSESLQKTERILKTIFSSLYSANVEVLLNPMVWRNHRHLVMEILNDGNQGIASGSTGPRLHLASLEKRSTSLMFRPPSTQDMSTPRRKQLEDLHKLDSMNADTNMAQLSKSFFDGNTAANSPNFDKDCFEEKVIVLLNWSMASSQLGIHRAYSVQTLLAMWRDQFKQYQSQAARKVNLDLFLILYKWLDTCEAAHSDKNAPAIGITFGELTRQGMFSYGRYLQTLIAQGHSARTSIPGRPRSHHLTLLAAMPIFIQARDLLNQRRLALTGSDELACQQEELAEERMLQMFKQEAMEYVPEVFGYKRYGRSLRYKEAIDYKMPHAAHISRHVLIQARFWLYPLASASLQRQGKRPAMSASSFARIIHLFHLFDAYSTIADFMIEGIRKSPESEVLELAVDVIRQDADVWTAMDRWSAITKAIWDRLQDQQLKDKEEECLALADMLKELALKDRIPPDVKEDVQAYISSSTKDLPTPNAGLWDAKESMGSLYTHLTRGDSVAALAITPRLFSRHGGFKSWSDLWWSTIVGAITSQNAINTALKHIDAVTSQAAQGLNGVVTSWLESVGVSELLQRPSGHLVYRLLLSLCASRQLDVVPLLLEKLVYPIWKQSAVDILKTGRMNENDKQGVLCVTTFAAQLLLPNPPTTDLPPTNLRQAIIMQTQRAKVFDARHVKMLLQHLPFLVVIKQVCLNDLRQNISVLLHDLAGTPRFKAAAFRNLNIVKDALLSTEWSKSSKVSNLETGMVDALKLVMSEDSSGEAQTMPSLDSSSSSSAWRWTSVVLSMRVEFKRLAMQIEDGDTGAQQDLKKLIQTSLDNGQSADDADLLCEAFRGIEPVVAQEITAIGTDKLKTLLAQAINAETQTDLDKPCQSIDLLLRILDHPSRAMSIWANQAILSARHSLLDLSSVALQSVERQISSDVELPEGVNPPYPGDILRVVLRLLRFALSLNVTDGRSGTSPRPDFARLASSYLKVLVSLPDGMDNIAYDKLVDMMTLIIDSCPSSGRLALHTTLLAEANSDFTSGSLLQALPIQPTHSRVMSIRPPTSTPGGGSEEVLLPLEDRNWELFEHLQPIEQRARGQDFYLGSNPIRDTSSIPISLFAPQLREDRIEGTEEDVNEDQAESDDDSFAGVETHMDMYASERDLGNDISGSPLLSKQLATAIYAGPEEASVEDDITILPIASTSKTSHIGHAASPSSVSIASETAKSDRTSALTQALNKLAGGSNKDPITLDDDDDGQDSKNGEDDVPKTKRARTGSKSAAGSVGGKTVRKTTGGKTAGSNTTGRKTTGGKTARKSTGGKNVKGGGRGGRRRSVNN